MARAGNEWAEILSASQIGLAGHGRTGADGIGRDRHGAARTRSAVAVRPGRAAVGLDGQACSGKAVRGRNRHGAERKGSRGEDGQGVVGMGLERMGWAVK